MDFDTLQELIRIFESSDLNEIEVEENGQRMRLQKAPPVVQAPAPIAIPQVEAPEADSESASSEEPDPTGGLPTIDSPMVGTFYVAPGPGEPNFVNQGDTVDPEQSVCIVEAMKLMNEVAAKVRCVIERVLVENGEPVEFGQPLFAIRPLD